MNEVLIIGPSFVGDMVMAQSLFKFLKFRYPDVKIDVLAPSWTEPLMARMPEVRKAILSPFKHGELKLAERYQLARELKKNHYHRSIVLPNSFKSALLPFLARIPQRTGWRGEMRWGLLNDVRYLNKKQLPMMVQRFIALGVRRGEEPPSSLKPFFPSLQVPEKSVSQTLAQLGLEFPSKPLLALCPGAEYGPAKQWLPDYFAKVASQKMDEGFDVWLFGSPNDQSIAKKIMEFTEFRCVDLVGKTHLSQAVDLLSLAKVVVSNDSGLMHVAAALNRPLVVIYGSSSSAFTPPLSEKVRPLSLNVTCSPCYERVCPLHHFHCMKNLLPERVLHALEGWEMA